MRKYSKFLPNMLVNYGLKKYFPDIFNLKIKPNTLIHQRLWRKYKYSKN